MKVRKAKHTYETLRAQKLHRQNITRDFSEKNNTTKNKTKPKMEMEKEKS